jgi:flagellar protein FlaG
MRVERTQPDFKPMEDFSRISRDPGVGSTSQANNVLKENDDQNGEAPKDLMTAKVKELNQAMEIFNHKFRFKVHDETHRVIVQILDSTTDEVVEEIPPEKFLDMVADMEKAVGLIIDKKA